MQCSYDLHSDFLLPCQASVSFDESLSLLEDHVSFMTDSARYSNMHYN